jgi:hypothetical protein
MAKESNWLSITGFILSLVSILIPFVAILSLIFCIIGLYKSPQNKGLAITGMVISGIILLLMILGIGFIALNELVSTDNAGTVNPFEDVTGWNE